MVVDVVVVVVVKMAVVAVVVAGVVGCDVVQEAVFIVQVEVFIAYF